MDQDPTPEEAVANLRRLESHHMPSDETHIRITYPNLYRLLTGASDGSWQLGLG